MEEKPSEVIKERAALWSQWCLFPPGETHYSTIFEKQIGLISDSQSFSHRSKWHELPGVVNIFESILSSLELRYKKGLYKNKHQYYLDIQNALQECLKAYRDHQDVIIESFQNKTMMTISKEKDPKVVVTCNTCKQYSLINLFCPTCHNEFYCDQACLTANRMEHVLACKEAVGRIPKILEPLQVEIRSYSWNQRVSIYYEHETKFSLKARGNKFFQELKEILLKNKLVKAHNYNTILDKNVIELSFESSSSGKELAESNRGDSDRSSKDKSPKLNQSIRRDITDTSGEGAKLPIIQELKMVLLEMGGIVADILQEKYYDKSSYIHVFLLP